MSGTLDDRTKRQQGTNGSSRRTQYVRLSIVSGLAYFLFTFSLFGAWVHYFYAGSYSGPLLMSTMFGVTQANVAAGASPVYNYPVAGWDGQFYYTQSNDPLMLVDYTAEPGEHSEFRYFDNLSYRYQRNGLPMLAAMTSRLLGESFTSPLTYFVTQFVVTSFGFGLLFAFLSMRGVSGWWACLWGFYGGVLRPLAHGLPDPTADAFLLISILCLLQRNLWAYSLSSVVLCLCRESYAAPAAVVWVMTAGQWLRWNERQPFVVRILLSALPGIIVLSWAGYLAYRIDVGLLHGSRQVPWGGLVDWPFKAFFQCLVEDLRAGKENDVIHSTSCAVAIGAVLLAALRLVRHHREVCAILPHLVLMAMTGSIVWEAGVGFFKNAGSVVLIGLLLSTQRETRWIRWILCITFALSLQYAYRHDWARHPFLPPLPLVESFVQPKSIVASDHPPSNYELKVVKDVVEETQTGGIFQFVRRNTRVITVRASNLSNQEWPSTLPGPNAITIQWRTRLAEKVLQADRIPMYKSIKPNESIDVQFRLPTDLWWKGYDRIECRIDLEDQPWPAHSDESDAIVIEH